MHPSSQMWLLSSLWSKWVRNNNFSYHFASSKMISFRQMTTNEKNFWKENDLEQFNEVTLVPSILEFKQIVYQSSFSKQSRMRQALHIPIFLNVECTWWERSHLHSVIILSIGCSLLKSNQASRFSLFFFCLTERKQNEEEREFKNERERDNQSKR